MPPEHESVRKKLAAIEAEMRRIGMWQAKPLAEDQYDFREAFARDTMAFAQWLQFIFVPRVKSIVEAQGEFPSGSSVGTQALREFDGDAEAGKLASLLCEFDGLFDDKP